MSIHTTSSCSDWRGGGFGYPYTEGFVPHIPRPQTEKEDLAAKPRAQKSYVDVYPKMLAPQPTDETYRQFYYYLQKESDQHIYNVYERLKNSPFFENNHVLFTADHGDLLGAHGGMHQKWHNAYEEATHVPLIISNPVLFKEPRNARLLTSHVDIIPTLLGLAEIDAAAVQQAVSKTHDETRTLVGRNLAPVVLGQQDPNRSTSPLYFMTKMSSEPGPPPHYLRFAAASIFFSNSSNARRSSNRPSRITALIFCVL